MPVLLLHGLASTRRIWDLVAPRLSGLPVVALDLRGHGQSERPAGPYDAATVARDVLTAMDALGLDRAVVVGHSWGGSTALRLAADTPGRILAVVALDGGLSWHRSEVTDRAELRRLLTPPRIARPLEELRDLLRQGPLSPWWSEPVEQAVLANFAVGGDGLARARLPFEAHMALVDDLLEVDATQLLDRVTCPAWMVVCQPVPTGGDDAGGAGRREAKRAALMVATERLARPRAQEWHGAVHDVPLQWPALVAGLVRAACDETITKAAAGEGASA